MKHIKFNWGTGIFITIIVMLLWLAFLINKSFEYKINIDSDDYYERGLVHTSQMERIKRSLAYQKDFEVELNSETILIKYPSYFENKELRGELWFYRPSDYELDKKIAVSNKESNMQSIHILHFKKGKYLLRATFSADSLSYFFERELIIK
ncbi:MAG: FixH family protein [Bacteroidota bacterium]